MLIACSKWSVTSRYHPRGHEKPEESADDINRRNAEKNEIVQGYRLLTTTFFRNVSGKKRRCNHRDDGSKFRYYDVGYPYFF
mmetsp:Transcript_12351/g.26275  ORF Transcript_12351/g.26275 Transcript_12351/m.26275 type:complete len:82 (-) Transcript_12351:153-398(-)